MNWFDLIKQVVHDEVRKLACYSITRKVSTGDPTLNDIKDGAAKLWKNTTSGTVKLYYNDRRNFKISYSILNQYNEDK